MTADDTWAVTAVCNDCGARITWPSEREWLAFLRTHYRTTVETIVPQRLRGAS